MKKKIIGIIGGILGILLLLLGGFFGYYQKSLKSVNKKHQDISFVIQNGKSTISILNDLKKYELINNVNMAKIYIKLNKINNLQAGTYILNDTYSLEEILTKFTNGDVIRDEIVMTFIEGKRIPYYAEVIAQGLNVSKDEVLKVMNDKKYLETLINNYWFITKDILNSKIYYPLEGYIFPDTYNFKKDVTIQEVITTLVDTLGKKLEPFKEEILNSSYSPHQILTLASIIELEGATSNDRSGVAGVFYNRLKDNWTLGSDVTTYYAVQKDFNVELTWSEYNDCNPYNTRSSCFTGLPVGPICASSLNSLKATIEPTMSDYYYFVADKNKKTYFMKTDKEFQTKISELKTQGLWYVY